MSSHSAENRPGFASGLNASPMPLPEVFKRVAEAPIDAALDRMTWRAAWLAAARIVEESDPIPPGSPTDGGAS